jgi:hypothetical protein
MPDLGALVSPLFDLFGPVLRVALRALLRTVFGMLILASVCSALAVLYAARESVLGGLVTAAFCLVLSGVATGLLAAKNAVLRGVLEGVRSLGLGAKTVTAIFSYLGVTDASTHGERGGLTAKVAERIPLREAEARLRSAAESLLHERSTQTGVRGWLARKLLGAIVEKVERLTLARLHAMDSDHGGIDLAKVRAELATSADTLLARQIEAQMQRLTRLVAIGYMLSVALVAVVAGAAFKHEAPPAESSQS